MAEHHAPDPFEHVLDSHEWEFFPQLFGDPLYWNLPKIPLGFGYELQVTKFMIMELIAALLILLIFIPVSRWSANGGLPRGKFWNAFESLLTFIRDKVARPNLGKEDGDKLTPYLWTLFLFILFCNLLGLFPMLGSATASLNVTLGLAVCSFVLMHGVAIYKAGPLHYLQALWPKIDVPYVGWVFSLFIFVIELFGTFIKSGVLAVRLFANIFAGHLVLVTILTFIYAVGMVGNPLLWGGVTVASVIGVALLSLLELFVAFLQAYVFTFLTALFIGMSLHHGGEHEPSLGHEPAPDHGP
jgi:F-type H+-transporting ATPase subunit a